MTEALRGGSVVRSVLFFHPVTKVKSVRGQNPNHSRLDQITSETRLVQQSGCSISEWVSTNGSSFSSVQYYKKLVEENLYFSTGTQVKSVYTQVL